MPSCRRLSLHLNNIELIGSKIHTLIGQNVYSANRFSCLLHYSIICQFSSRAARVFNKSVVCCQLTLQFRIRSDVELWTRLFATTKQTERQMCTAERHSINVYGTTIKQWHSSHRPAKHSGQQQCWVKTTLAYMVELTSCRNGLPISTTLNWHLEMDNAHVEPESVQRILISDLR